MEPQVLENAQNFIDFLNKSPTPFHVVESARNLLTKAGFVELKISDPWSTKNGGKYFVTKNDSTLVAFIIGGKYQLGNGFLIVGAHTDSPTLKLRTVSRKAKFGFLQAGVECYGSGIWHTWFDRDLTLAGRVLLNKNGKIHQKLIHINKPILKIPTLAIHLNREANEKFSFSREIHLMPILATMEEMMIPKMMLAPNSLQEKKPIFNHHPLLINLITKELDCEPDEINELELTLVDTQPAVLGGGLNEFIFGSRLDNQISSYCSIKALIDSLEPSEIEEETGIRVAAIYDNEECGSNSSQGAGSAFTEHVLRRLSDSNSFELAITRSFLVSADQAHAIHPNYPEMHEENHRATLNGGIMVMVNTNQSYATNGISASILREAAKIAQVPLQDYNAKNDCPCGSTIGPILSTKLGLTAVDIGIPQLSMHSIRETGSTLSITQLTKLLVSIFKNYTKIRHNFSEVL